MHIALIGTRGIPAKYGGFETFADKISRQFVQMGYEVTVQCDYASFDSPHYNGVNLYFSGFTKDQHPVRYYYDGLKWAVKNSDIIIVATTFGSFFYFLNLLKGRVIITNTDGIEYRRPKWGVPQKLYIRLSELFAALFSDCLIADSSEIAKHLTRKYPFIRKKIRVIEYGAEIIKGYEQSAIADLNVIPGSYYLVVSRLEPENNIQMIIDGYLASGTTRPLLVVGKIKDTAYVRKAVSSATGSGVRFVGAIYSKEVLDSLRFCCAAYIHGHSVGGTNPSLLEAMGCGNLCVCHGNAFNREVTDNSQMYFLDSSELGHCINEAERISEPDLSAFKEKSVQRIHGHYNWERITGLYRELLNEISL